MAKSDDWKQILNKFLGEKIPGNVFKLIKVRTNKLPNGIQHTFSVVAKGKTSEDEVYSHNKWLQENIPRGFSLYVDNKEKIYNLNGPRKFAGKTKMDDDDETLTSIFNKEKIEQWEKEGTLTINILTKENGKFCIVRIIDLEGTPFIWGGSKNKHVLQKFEKEEIENLISSMKVDKDNEIIVEIFQCLLEQFDELKNYYEDGGFVDSTLVGELCDGLHIIPLKKEESKHIKWFSKFGKGGVIPGGNVEEILEELERHKLPTVSHKKIVDSTVDKVLSLSRCGVNEGSVIYFTNKQTRETILCKSKSAYYILARMFRQIMTKGDKTWESFIKRVWETREYHCLTTNALERVFKFYWNFLRWFYSTGFPVKSLDFIENSTSCEEVGITGVVGINGIGNFLQHFTNETENSLAFSSEDFDEEDISYTKYRENIGFIERTNKEVRKAEMPLVVFIQAIQGSGKSTMAKHVIEILRSRDVKSTMVEQDRFNGCTKTCQAFLRHRICETYDKIIILSRCNVNETQYSAYLNLCQVVGARVAFITPEHQETKLSIALSLAGIYNRSKEGDKLIAGRKVYPKETVMDFLGDFSKSYDKHPKAITIKWFKDEFHNKMEEFEKLENIRQIDDKISELGVHHFMNLRKSCEEVALDIIRVINSLTKENLVVPPVSNKSNIYFYLRSFDKYTLCKFIEERLTSCSGTYECGHITQRYCGGKSPSTFPAEEVIPDGEVVTCHIKAMVINTNGAIAFDVDRLTSVEGKTVQVASGKPHVTGFVPEKCSASDSIKFVDKTIDVERIPVDFTFNLNCVHVVPPQYGRKK